MRNVRKENRNQRRVGRKFNMGGQRGKTIDLSIVGTRSKRQNHSQSVVNLAHFLIAESLHFSSQK
jgi:hypothetical protein